MLENDMTLLKDLQEKARDIYWKNTDIERPDTVDMAINKVVSDTLSTLLTKIESDLPEPTTFRKPRNVDEYFAEGQRKYKNRVLTLLSTYRVTK
jgi:hypothetical protein